MRVQIEIAFSVIWEATILANMVLDYLDVSISPISQARRSSAFAFSFRSFRWLSDKPLTRDAKNSSG